LAEEGDPEAFRRLTERVQQIEGQVGDFELSRLLGGEHHARNAIGGNPPGAGGLEGQDWAEMLLRMYLRWCERRGFRVELLGEQTGGGAGLKSAADTVEGRYVNT